MSTRQRPLDLALEDERRILERIRLDVREARIAQGLRQADLAAHAQMSRSQVSRYERGLVGSVAVGEACRLLRAVGLAPFFSTAPTGVRVRDAPSLRILGRFSELVAPPLRLPREVLLPGPEELRAWDAAVVADDGRAFVEAVSRLGDIQALSRYAAVKLRDDGRSSVLILVVGRTKANQAVLALHRDALRQQFPLDGAAIARSLRAGRLPSASGIIVL